MQMIVEQNLGLVHSIAGRYDVRVLPETIDRNDLISEGLMGLMHAVRKFDATRGTQFSTYAVWWVRQRMQRCLQKQKPITTSIQIETRRERLARVADQFLTEYGRSASSAELAEMTSLSRAQVNRATDVPAVAFSLDAPIGQRQYGMPTNDSTGDYVPATDDLAPVIARLDTATLCGFLEQCLPSQHWQVLQMRLGIGSSAGSALNDAQIGQRLGVSRQRANFIYQQAIDLLREPHLAKQLLDLIDPNALNAVDAVDALDATTFPRIVRSK